VDCIRSRVASRNTLLTPLHLDDKKKSIDTPSTNSVRASPDPVVNQLDDTARETFATGRPLEDSLELHQCKHCKRSVLKTELKGHVVGCLKLKKEKAQRKKEQKEAREREKKEMDGEKKDGDGDTRMDDDDDPDDDASPEKKGPGGLKSAKKSAGKKVEIDDATKKGKKRKADGDAEKGPKQKKKKEEPKPKAPKPKGIPYFLDMYNPFFGFMLHRPAERACTMVLHQ
jgi:SAGA-associated factor 73